MPLHGSCQRSGAVSPRSDQVSDDLGDDEGGSASVPCEALYSRVLSLEEQARQQTDEAYCYCCPMLFNFCRDTIACLFSDLLVGCSMFVVARWFAGTGPMHP